MGRPLAMQIFLRTSEEIIPESPAQAVKPWHDSHWGTRLLELRDPDGSTVTLQLYPSRR